ncbi:hypothetical protein CDAR_479641 [Caerostris darwini]|uniref:Uncharacterized protein n=1 Tax=Caerostris darwini TaxID=1538125 RepID=A0AAV4STL0_9ARAC|nr:hypothetical protein CDAR_479641 [Caerostris darwini]
MIFQKKLSFITKPKEIQNKSTIADIPTQQSHIKTILPTCKLLSVRTTLKRLLISIQQKQSRIPPPFIFQVHEGFLSTDKTKPTTKSIKQPKLSKQQQKSIGG